MILEAPRPEPTYPGGGSSKDLSARSREAPAQLLERPGGATTAALHHPFVLTLAMVALIESLLSASIVDEMTDRRK